MRILLQFPEGLKKHALDYVKKLESEGHEVFLHAAPVYGACDLALEEAKFINAKKIIHFGHAPFPIYLKPKIKVEYVEWKKDIEPESLSITIPELKKYKKIALGTTVQHSDSISKIIRFLKENGISVLTKKGTLTAYKGQVLGCDSTAINIPEAEAILFIGDGMFHALAIGEEKPVYVFNPYTKQFKQINSEIERLRKRRRGAIAAALEAKKFGILISTKPGQFNLKAAKWAKKELEKIGKHSTFLIANEFSPLSIANFMAFDAYVSTACPRIADDTELFEKPILNILMLKELLEMLK
ncbi:diphthamide biosynthesis enzyme Dph2 [Candidatus Micrarchaeota archaeon]|nr:diphthamide biosynthesis enzyme Dph2 [Candidatus Micrarchaeota archaeon]